MMTMRPWSRLVAILACLTFTLPCSAQSSAANKAAAEALFNEGRTLIDQGRFGEACSKFEASAKLDEGLGTQLHLADCYERAGRLASAWASFKEVESLAKVKGDAERSKIARVRAEALEARLGRIVIVVPEQRPEGFEVTRNGEPLLPMLYNTPTPVDPGSWEVRATAPGHEPYEISVVLSEQQAEPLTVEIPALTPLPADPPSPDTASQEAPMTDLAPPPARGSTQRTAGLVVAGVGVVAGIVSLVFTVRSVQKNDDSMSACEANNDCTEAGFRARNEAFDFADVATGAGIVAVLGLGAGSALYFTAPSDEPAPGEGSTASAPRASTLGLWWEGTW